MAATSIQIYRLRRMIAESTEETYTDSDIAEAIERYPLPDSEGLESGDDEWVATYDLNAAAAEIWMEKAAARADNINFSSDGARFDDNDQHVSALRMARYYAARRMPSSLVVSR